MEYVDKVVDGLDSIISVSDKRSKVCILEKGKPWL